MRRLLLIRDRIPKPLLALIVVASVIVITGAIHFYHSQKAKIMTRTNNELGIITTLKAEEVRKWRQEHIRDGSVISRFFSSDRSMYNLLGEAPTEGSRMEVLQRLKLFLDDYDYHSAVILDKTGNIRLTYPPSASTGIKFTPVKEFKSREIDFSDIHISEDLKIPHIDMLIPVIPPDSVNFSNSGTIVLRINPAVSLFPNLQILSTPTLPAEIMLIRRDNDSVIYLNLKEGDRNFLKRSMSNRKLPAVKAVEGVEGFLEGNDYNNIPVLAYLRKIQGTPWFIVAKVEKGQALQVLYWQTIMVAIMVLLFISLFTATVFYVWKNQNTHFYKELSDTKDRFVSIIAHDLTSPFATIAGFCDILIDDIKNGNSRNVLRYAETIRDSSLSAMALLKNLSQWSRLQSNQIRLNPEMTDLTRVIDESVNLMRPFAERKKIDIKISRPADLTIYADRQMLSTILRNLVTNAIKYSNTGDSITVKAVKEKDEVVFDVIDTGTGMDKELLEKIFNSDNNISRPGTMDEPGTGLGLSLCKEFVERHGGSIYAESKPGEGSKFTFTIPDHSYPR